MEARPTTALALLFVPILVLNVLRFGIPPIDAMFTFSTELMLVSNGIAIIFGIFLFRRTQRVRDHEWQRTKALKSTKKQFKVEESGVWERDVDHGFDTSNVSKEALEGTVARINLEGKEIELDRDETTEVQFLMDSQAVIKATHRVTGKDNFDQNPIQSTVGATRKIGFMDRSIDYVMSLFGKDSIHEREQKRTAILTQRAVSEPIIAQKPIAPLQRIEGDDPATNLEIMSLSDTGGVIQAINTQAPLTIEEQKSMSGSLQSQNFNSPTTGSVMPQSSTAESIEQMAMGSTISPSPQRSGQVAVAGPRCSVCGVTRNPIHRFCDSCGAE